jgi:hypothetical protein
MSLVVRQITVAPYYWIICSFSFDFSPDLLQAGEKLDSWGSQQTLEADSCEHGNETSSPELVTFLTNSK